ncbi:MAG: hypothetical protein NC293_03085 [Roseburia sp.]|nr:hypothetical protein [Roseburia sp.]
MNRRKQLGKMLIISTGLILTGIVLFHKDIRAALSDEQITEILVKNKDLFTNNSIAGSVLRTIGWGLLFLLALLGSACADLYDTCFGFVDFTSYDRVTAFINDFKPVFIALICASLVFLGILLVFWQDKKPKFVMNLVIAVLVVSSSSFIIDSMNGFLASDVRSEIMGNDRSSGMVYETIGSNIHDLLYLDAKVGLSNLDGMTGGINNSEITYDSFTEEQFMTLDINETVDGDSVKDESQDIVEKEVSMKYENLKTVYSIASVYDGVAWTDLLNEYYYRYTVDWFVVYLELLSLIIVYLFMSYKVIRLLFEIVVHRLLAYLYSANLTNNQKILKILDSLKDSYIVLIMTTVCIKLYLLACKFISGWQISGISKGIILLFIAFVVIDGPNLVQKLTGIDAGLSDGMGKLMTMFYGSQMAGSVVRAGAGVVGAGAGIVGKGGRFVKDHAMNHAASGKAAFEESMAGGNGDMPDGSPGGADDSNVSQNQNEENRTGDKFNQNNISNDQDQNASISEQNHMMGGEGQEMKQGQESLERGEFASSVNQPESGHIPPDDASPKEMSSLSASDGGKDAHPGSSAMKQDRSMKDQNYQMDGIGKNLQGKADALNGIQSGRGESPVEEMRSMEKELGLENGGVLSSGYGEHKPLDAGGSMLSQRTPPTAEGSSQMPGQKAENRMAREVLKNEQERKEGGM